MIKILISFLICFAVSKDLIIIGDARIQEMSEVLMNVGYSEYDYRYSTYNFLMTENPVSYEGYYIDVVAVMNALKKIMEHYLNI